MFKLIFRRACQELLLNWKDGRKAYPRDVSDEEWAFVAPYLTLMREDAPQRDYSGREAFNGWRWIIGSGAQWRMMPNDLPRWYTVHQQAQRWLKAGVFEAMVHDRDEEPLAAIVESHTLQSSPESGERAGYDGARRLKGTKCTWRWIHWATGWPCTSPGPMNKTVLRCRKWRIKSKQ